ncbi:ATPase [Vibrio sp. ABG19]|uniref:ATPase n=1 Tax=Vibrio sp. ABG19 TaxID=2817385 RepID=UPI00249DF226|nr:ATPase [Vibrio sp. ABG19]WGY45234.1 ATPase [Vibrio sp. ABG19]
MSTNHNDEFEVTGNESLEEIEALLAAAEGGEDEFADLNDGTADEPTGNETQGTTVDRSEGDTDAASPPAEQDATPEGILAKDQKHIIPMDVLEKERQENARLRKELEASNAISEQYAKANRIIEARNKQLEELGVAPADLPEDIQFDDEKLASLKEDYPELADYFQALSNKIDGMVKSGEVAGSTSDASQPASKEIAAQESSNAVDTEVQAAFQANSDLTGWASEGGQRWSMAQQIDDHLSSSPEWQGRSYAERFDEVSKRVRLAFGDEPKPTAQEAQKAAQQASDKAKGSLPASPSELGNTNRPGNSDLMTRVENASAAELSAMFDNMTQAQIEQVLANAGF